MGDGSAGNKRGESCGGELMHVAVFCGANDKRQRSSAALTPVSQDASREHVSLWLFGTFVVF